jgi:hypothetical protein
VEALKSCIFKGSEVDLCLCTSETPCFKIVRPSNELEVIEVNLQSRFRSGVAMLLYLIQNSKADITNVVRELAKCMDGATLEVFKEML